MARRMQAHIGMDEDSGLVHLIECTASNVADLAAAHVLPDGSENTVSGASGYTGGKKRDEMQKVKGTRPDRGEPART